MLRHDINIGHIRARQLVADDFEQFHLIIALDPPSAQQARALAQVESGRRRVQLLSDLTGSPDIPDPIEGSLRVFEEVFATLDGASDRLVGEIEKRLTRPECQDWPL
jgi:protein-tyrosine phosphatase